MNSSDLTGGQRLVRLYMALSEGTIIRPTQYARETNVTRQTVYYQLQLLSGMGIPVVNVNKGQYTLLKYVKDEI